MNELSLLPISNNDSMPAFVDTTDPFTTEIVKIFREGYKKFGYHEPWITYWVLRDKQLVALCGFKKAPDPVHQVEITYAVLPEYEGLGIATKVCSELIRIKNETNVDLIVKARTLPRESASTKVLRKNHFRLLSQVWDTDDGAVWEWQL